MKRRLESMHARRHVFLALTLIGWLPGGCLAGAPARQPIYIYLYARVTDQVNIGMSEDRLRHILPLVERYRQMHPEGHLSATVLFSGAVSEALQQRNAQTHILDFVKDYIRRGAIAAGYDGRDEPTYQRRPTLEFSGQESPEDRWKMRQSVAERFLAEARDPLTGAPSAGAGGLKEMEAVFGPAACIRGVELAVKTIRPAPRVATKLGVPPATVPQPVSGIFTEVGGDTETLQALRPYNTTAVMSGIAAINPAQFVGFRTASTRFGALMAPIPEAAPEIFWQDYILRMSEANGPVHPVAAQEGVEAAKGILNSASRQTIQVVRVELGGAEKYLQPAFAKTAPNAPLRYAYEHPADPKLPADALAPAVDTEAAWKKEDAVMQWLAEVYVPANAGSRFVSDADILKLAGPATGFEISTGDLRSALTEMLTKWGNDTYPFSYITVNGRYLSLAELFQVLTDELAELHRTGKLPQTVKALKVYGPIRLVTGHGPNIGEVAVGDLARICGELDGPLHDDSSTAMPNNAIPSVVKITGMDLNPAQVLRLMAQAVVNPAPETSIRVRMTYMLGEAGGIFPKSRPLFDDGFVWTIKPAPLKAGVSN
jgi:hypothetical protein